ncbi:MAG: YdbL family protein [Desulfobacterales bacterium]
MMRPVTTRIVFFCISALLLAGSLSFAEDIKSRMKARKPTISALKAQGIIGENSQGYLEYVGTSDAKAEAVASENSDRKKVYAAIARQQGVTAALVGKQRAMQIEKKSNPGMWFRDQSGKWHQK